MQAGDLLVFNDTQVVKARIFGEKSTGGKVELLIERVLPGRRVVAHMKVSKKPPLGATLLMGIDHKQLTYRHSGRDFRLTDVHGRIITPVVA